MNLQSYSKGTLLAAVIVAFTSCNPDKDNEPTVDVPASYVFTVDGESTVAFGGQTARLQMADELMSALNTENSTQTALAAMFNDGTGFDGAGLDASGKKLGNKTSAYGSATVKGQFDDMITDFATNVVPNWNVEAVAGTAGVHSTLNRTVRINAKGMEMNQCFAKGLIGALCVDQIANGYLSEDKIGDSVDNENRTDGHTTMEHHWDEGYGYLYGLDNQASPVLGAPDDVLLNKYLKKVNESNEPGIADVIFDAFKHGRAAIVANASEIKMEQAQIVKENISKIIAYKAIDYLREAADDLDAAETDMADYFHGLSEGYGFVLSLQFTYNDAGIPYFSNDEVNGFLDTLESGNGFWDRTSTQLNDMANEIEARAELN